MMFGSVVVDEVLMIDGVWRSEEDERMGGCFGDAVAIVASKCKELLLLVLLCLEREDDSAEYERIAVIKRSDDCRTCLPRAVCLCVDPIRCIALVFFSAVRAPVVLVFWRSIALWG
mmetsp:Transcript_15006/g.32205  ORF Transcript_15006/g.32205 Transcript_15006/m.32205 type:complete len:116 (-) Transcript_15006:316-663(-)